MESSINEAKEVQTGLSSKFKYFPFFNNKQPVFVLFLIGIIFYSTSLYNEYALDDGIVIHQNDEVLKGVRGIKDIMSSDVYASFYKRMNATDQLQGGRYRPLSIVSFALEQELIGTYRTGNYTQVEDLNDNGKLDDGEVSYKVKRNEKADNSTSVNKTNNHQDEVSGNRINYEYNNYEDLNGDGKAQQEECYNCWDLNRNFKNDASEDLNKDGIFNEVDCQVNGAFIRHFNNIWLYVLACILLYNLFRNYFFKDNQDLAFLAALIFLAHPIHSEVVANVKSRDDIFSLLFIILTFIYAFKFEETKRTGSLIACAAMFFLALLSKEFGLLLLVLLPLSFHVFTKLKIERKGFFIPLISFAFISCLMIWLAVENPIADFPSLLIYLMGLLIYGIVVWLVLKKQDKMQSINTIMICLQAISLLYFTIRFQSIRMAPGVPDTEILNNPYLLANAQEAFATKIVVLLKYLSLSIFPHPLISDYSFDTIKYRHFTDLSFIFSAAIHVFLLIVGIKLTIKQRVLGFAIMTYLIFLILVTNIIFPIGASMGERLLFHSSVGFAIALAWLILKGIDALSAWSIKMKRTFLISSLTVLVFLYGCKTWERNWDWKNDVTLFLKDVKNAPNSVLILGNAGARWIDLADTKEITGFNIPGQDSSIVNDYNGQLKISDAELKAGGFKNKREAALQRGIGYLKHAIELHPRYVNGYLNLGLAEFKLGHDDKAIYYWENARFLYPDNPYLKLYYNVYGGILKQRAEEAMGKANTNEAIKQLRYLIVIAREQSEPWYLLGKAFKQTNELNKAKNCLLRAKQIDPKDEATNKAIQEWFGK
ncbi:MAG: glycosyltransferase family 39 protein [Bacteroidota bacterium]